MLVCEGGRRVFVLGGFRPKGLLTGGAFVRGFGPGGGLCPTPTKTRISDLRGDLKLQRFSKVKIIYGIVISLIHLPITAQRKVAETQKLAGKLSVSRPTVPVPKPVPRSKGQRSRSSGYSGWMFKSPLAEAGHIVAAALHHHHHHHHIYFRLPERPQKPIIIQIGRPRSLLMTKVKC